MLATRLALAGLALPAAVACAPLTIATGARVAPPPIEPPAATTFIASHAAAAAVPPASLSPLYAAESIRRGRGPDARDRLWTEAAPRLRFEPVAWLVDARGFGHALYLARPRARPGP